MRGENVLLTPSYITNPYPCNISYMFGCLRGTMVVSIVWPSGYLVSFETVNYPDGFGRKFEGIQQQGEFFLTLKFSGAVNEIS